MEDVVKVNIMEALHRQDNRCLVCKKELEEGFDVFYCPVCKRIELVCKECGRVI